MPRIQSPHLWFISLVATLLGSRPAHAMGVSFELAKAVTEPVALSEIASPQTAPRRDSPQAEGTATLTQPLPVPEKAGRPPVRDRISIVKLNQAQPIARVLPPTPPQALPRERVLEPRSINQPKTSAPADIGLSFRQAKPAAVGSGPTAVSTSASRGSTSPQVPGAGIPAWIYQGGSDSLVARTVGAAEGTRTATGKRTKAYYGHRDPGNGVWNLGTFSYQHGARSPEEADQKQLARLERQGHTIAQQARRKALQLSLQESLNALDLANQAPRAALDTGGYVDRLAEARQQGLAEEQAILWARTHAYLDPRTQRWDAPGLGNTYGGIRHDQRRRQTAISRALQSYSSQPAEAATGDDGATATPTLKPAESAPPASISLPVAPRADRSQPTEEKPRADLGASQATAAQPASLSARLLKEDRAPQTAVQEEERAAAAVPANPMEPPEHQATAAAAQSAISASTEASPTDPVNRQH